ncbi:MAG: ABC transporter ATP-binding protein [Bacillota bacterium]
MSADTVVEVRNLCKRYGTVQAVDDVSFEVRSGEVFTLVGPNGAGKTTTLECLEGLRVPSSGSVNVLGLDPLKARSRLKARVGIQLQESALQPNLKVWEACDLFSSFYETAVDWRALLDRLGLADKRNTAFSKLSGGQKQRLYVALALLHDPELVFLDEITTGLDPQARHGIWELVLEVKRRGKTVILTTHYMEEAAYLSDRVAIIDAGRIVALDSPAKLVNDLAAGVKVSFALAGAPDGFSPGDLKSVPGVVDVTVNENRVSVHGTGESLVAEVVQALAGANVVFKNLRSEEPTLEDVFFAKTGRKTQSVEEGR